jgi:molybdopterin-containing oxidoreductase family molybdopterin binding subunit
MGTKTKKIEIYDDTWIPTQCGRCFSTCSIRVHRINGIATRIEGNPDSWQGSRGGVCAKGASGLQVLYDPNRLNVPLRRTNPEKGLYVDPKWKEISWDEALDEIAEKLKKVLNDEPRKILIQSTTVRAPTASIGWRNFMASMLGTPNLAVGGAGIQCGNGVHYACGLLYGSWDAMPDYRYCNYFIYWGVHNGHATGHATMVSARLAAEALEKGIKLVVFDPVCRYAGSKATEWIPIIPGTDGVVALAMSNVILNELGIWDAVYLKTKTNGPYLIDHDGRYVRDMESKKPLVWDAAESKTKVYDDPGVIDYALEGTYLINGVKCQPAFQLLKEHLKKYTPEMASRVSTVPAETIRRIATEFAQAAQVGSTITIDGHQLPFRPVSSTTLRGGESHGNAANTVMAMFLLNHILGAADVPGGSVGLPNTSLGYPGTGKLKFGVEKGPDGLLTIKQLYIHQSPWPIEDPKFPTNAGLQELFTLCSVSPLWATEDREELWQKIRLPYRIEVMLNYGCNSIMGVSNPEAHADFLKKIPFIVHWDLFANEFAEGFADILLPDTSYLETSNWLDGQGFSFNYPYGMDPWCYQITQPVVKPESGRRYIMDVSFELLDRIGKRAQLNEYWNKFIGLEEADKFKLTEKISWEQVGDKALKHYFGPDHSLDWFKKHGGFIWPKKVEEAYWRCFTDARVPIYLEFMVDLKTKIKKIADQIGIKVNWGQYTPFTEWFPCTPHLVKGPEYDLYCFTYRDILHTNSSTMEQPWLDEVSKMNPYTYNISMSVETANQKGLKDRDLIEIESIYGHKIRGTLKLRKGQHPQTLGLVSAGHWAKGQPIASGKGALFTKLLETRLEDCDPITLNMELCVKVKVNKVERR